MRSCLLVAVLASGCASAEVREGPHETGQSDWVRAVAFSVEDVERIFEKIAAEGRGARVEVLDLVFPADIYDREEDSDRLDWAAGRAGLDVIGARHRPPFFLYNEEWWWGRYVRDPVELCGTSGRYSDVLSTVLFENNIPYGWEVGQASNPYVPRSFARRARAVLECDPRIDLDRIRWPQEDR